MSLKATLLPAWRDPTGQDRDSLGRSTSPEELARIADQAPAALREVETQKHYLRGTYRDPDQAGDALDRLIERTGHDLRVAAHTLREEGPEVLGSGKEWERNALHVCYTCISVASWWT